MTIFSQGEIERRRAALAKGMREVDAKAAVLWTPAAVYYATGMLVMDLWGRPNAVVLTDDGRCALIVSAGERHNAEENAWVDEVIPYGDARNALSAIEETALDVLRRYGGECTRLAIEANEAPHGVVARLSDALRLKPTADIGPALASARIVKSEEELALLRIGGEAAQAGMQACVDALVDGCTEADVVGAALPAMLRVVARRAPRSVSSHFAYCNAGLNTLTPHLHPTGRQIRTGDVVGLNVFPVVDGYLIELERTVVVGRASTEQERILSVVGEAFAAGKRTVRHGVPACDVYWVTRQIREAAGYGAYTRGGAGHAHGILIHTNGREELGEIRPYNKTELAAGMVISIEPGIYMPEVGAFRHSDVLLVTKNGSEVLTEFPTPITVP